MVTSREDRLFLDDVKVLTKARLDRDAPESEHYRSVLKTTFGDDKPRVATWFTGHLIVLTGELVGYVHMGYGSTYSSYLILTVVEGKVQRQRKLDTTAFQKFRRGGDDEPMSDELLEDFLFQFTSEEVPLAHFRGD